MELCVTFCLLVQLLACVCDLVFSFCMCFMCESTVGFLPLSLTILFYYCFKENMLFKFLT